jgi:hypothetical protein
MFKLPSHPSHFSLHLLRAAGISVIPSHVLAMAKVLDSAEDPQFYTPSPMVPLPLLPCLGLCQSSGFCAHSRCLDGSAAGFVPRTCESLLADLGLPLAWFSRSFERCPCVAGKEYVAGEWRLCGGLSTRGGCSKCHMSKAIALSCKTHASYASCHVLTLNLKLNDEPLFKMVSDLRV